MQYDIIIIGGGPAGSTAAYYLAKAGQKVLLLEKEKFPREHVGESLIPFCYHLFEDMGLLSHMESTYLRKPGVTFADERNEQVTHYCFNHVIQDKSSLSFHVRRAHFDHDLLKHAASHGAIVHEERKVIEVDFGEEISTVCCLTNKNEKEIFTARLIIDASGQNTFLAKKLNTKKPFERLNKRVAFSAHWEGANWTENLRNGNIEIVQLNGEKLGWIWLIPVEEDRLSIGLAINMSYMKSQKINYQEYGENWREALYKNELHSAVRVKEIISPGHLIQENVQVNSDFSFYSEKKFSDKYALVGDAHAFLDPIFSSGIFLAMKSAQLVAQAIIKNLHDSDKSALPEAYEKIQGAYMMVEELIYTFYNPGSLKFTNIASYQKFDFQSFNDAYNILHYVLAGDFFTNYEKYIKAIKLLRDKGMIHKFKHLINSNKGSENPQKENKLETCY